MIKKILLVFSTVVCFFPSHIARADCVDLGNFTSWVVTSPRTVLFSHGDKPLAFIDISDCIVHPLSTIVPPKSHVCDSDTLTIDGKECHILKLIAY
jgi:hypothetical protein